MPLLAVLFSAIGILGAYVVGVLLIGLDSGNFWSLMQARVDERPVIIVLLDAAGSQSRFADAQRIRRWIETQPRTPVPTVRASTPS